MIVRALDGAGDWTYGKGRNDYKSGVKAIAQNIQTRLSSFLGDCFFNTGAGIDWFHLLGAKDQFALNIAISSTILNTENVTGLLQLDLRIINRKITIKYNVQTTLSVLSDTFVYDVGTGA